MGFSNRHTHSATTDCGIQLRVNMNCVLLLLPLLAVACCHSTDLETKPLLNETETFGNDHDMGSTVTYRGRRYRFVTTPMTFVNAELYCQRLGRRGHLTSIHSYCINQLLFNLVRRCSHNVASAWIGGLQFLKSKHYIWLDGSRWDFARWAPGEPNNEYGREECAEMYITKKQQSYWNDIPCSLSRSFICEY
ncbi:lectin-like [Protopterus annectens]|uniref:lectin-like n=1 Tax=Protopterus annectens TaxID=7888 RepID=UPI001CFA1C8F|nr:lectin-like [Protopterus annectens]